MNSQHHTVSNIEQNRTEQPTCRQEIIPIISQPANLSSEKTISQNTYKISELFCHKCNGSGIPVYC